MTDIPNYFSKEDSLSFALPGLFENYGYKKYRMSKFEEYSFYSDNRNFLTDDGVIAFNNADGRLMALKPDITLSIIKNAKLSEKLTKLYYTESVFRLSASSGDFKEIKQCGVEVLGDIDGYISSEVILVALESLNMIDPNFTLSLSHNAILLSILEPYKLTDTATDEIFACISGKNTHDLKRIGEKYGIDCESTELLVKLSTIDAPVKRGLTELKSLCINEKMTEAYEELSSICRALDECGTADKVHIDLSVTMHSDYYTGIVFKGFVEKSPVAVLSGGRYDKLASKIRANIGAIGFAVYLDNLNLYYAKMRKFDSDVLIITGSEFDAPALLKAVKSLTESGKSVRVENKMPENFNAKETFAFNDKSLEEVR